KNKVEAHSRKVKSSLNKKNGTVNVIGSAVVQNLKKQNDSDFVCIKRDDCMSSDKLCVSNSMNDVKIHAKSKKYKSKKHKSKKDSWKPTGKVFTQIGYTWRPTGRTFTIVGNACPLTRITTTNEVPSRKPIALDSESPKPVVKLVYSRKPRKNKNTESVSKTKVVQIVLWYLDSGCSKHMTGDRSQLTNFISKFLGTVKFGNDQVAKIMGVKTKSWLLASSSISLELGFYQIILHDYGLILREDYEKVEFFMKHLLHALHSKTVLVKTKSYRLVRSSTALSDAMASEPQQFRTDLLEMTPVSNQFRHSMQNLLLKHHLYHLRDLTGIFCHSEHAGYPNWFTSIIYSCFKMHHISPSNSHTTQGTQTPIISHDVEEDNHDIEVAHMGNDPYFGIPIPEVPFDQSSDIIIPIVHLPINQAF
ncbi:hypothetical protein Tco_0464772, partial [Tanacetum coccineum]